MPATLALLLAGALAQAAPVSGPATADRTAPAPAADAARLQDRVATLVGQGKCPEAKDEANAAGATDLASQVDQLCGLGSPSSGKKGGGGAGRRGGGGGGGRRGSNGG